VIKATIRGFKRDKRMEGRKMAKIFLLMNLVLVSFRCFGQGTGQKFISVPCSQKLEVRMNRLRILVCLMIYAGFVFAQGLGKDSLQIDLLKRQKLFYSSNNNWIPPSLPDEEGCLGLGCCLFSIAGLLELYKVNKEYHLNSRIDTLQEYKKCHLVLGYNFSVCYTGSYFSRASPWTLLRSPLDFLYGLNSVDVGLSYRFHPKWMLEWQIGYGWAFLQDRQTGDWKIEKFSTTLRKRQYLQSLAWCWGIEFNYAKAYKTYSAKNDIKKCFGPGLLLSIEFQKPDVKRGWRIVPFLQIRLSTTFNYLPLSGSSGSEIIFSGIGGGIAIRK